MKIYINLNGCDDTTKFFMDCEEENLSFLRTLICKAAQASTYGCMPTIDAYIIEEEDYEKYLNWKLVDEISNDRGLTEEEKKVYYSFFTEYELEKKAVKKILAQDFRF